MRRRAVAEANAAAPPTARLGARATRVVVAPDLWGVGLFNVPGSERPPAPRAMALERVRTTRPRRLELAITFDTDELARVGSRRTSPAPPGGTVPRTRIAWPALLAHATTARTAASTISHKSTRC
jgi:hypothetical protein